MDDEPTTHGSLQKEIKTSAVLTKPPKRDAVSLDTETSLQTPLRCSDFVLNIENEIQQKKPVRHVAKHNRLSQGNTRPVGGVLGRFPRFSVTE